jgi:hypothetical protein
MSFVEWAFLLPSDKFFQRVMGNQVRQIGRPRIAEVDLNAERFAAFSAADLVGNCSTFPMISFRFPRGSHWIFSPDLRGLDWQLI